MEGILLFLNKNYSDLQYYLDAANDNARTSKYSGFLGSQYSAVVHYGTSGSGDIGNVWYAPSQGGSIFSPEASTSGLACIVAAAKVITFYLSISDFS